MVRSTFPSMVVVARQRRSHCAQRSSRIIANDLRLGLATSSRRPPCSARTHAFPSTTMSSAAPSIPSETIPDGETLEKVGRLTVFDEEGKNVEFGSIFVEKKTIVVFVRECPLN